MLPLLIYNQAISSRPGGLKGLLMIMVMTTKVIRLGLRVCEDTQIQRADDFSYCYVMVRHIIVLLCHVCGIYVFVSSCKCYSRLVNVCHGFVPS